MIQRVHLTVTACVALVSLFHPLACTSCNVSAHTKAQQQCLVSDGPQPQPQQPQQQKQQHAHWIVRFKAYDSQEQLHAYLHQGLAQAGLEEGAWSWVPRRNLASAIPSDFGLLAISSALQPAVAASLLQLPLVRDLHLDRRLEGSLKWVPEGPLADAMVMGGAGSGTGQRGAGAAPTSTPAWAPARGGTEDVGLGGAGAAEGGPVQKRGMEDADEDGEPEAAEDFDVTVFKRPGRFSTPFLMEPEAGGAGEGVAAGAALHRGRDGRGGSSSSRGAEEGVGDGEEAQAEAEEEEEGGLKGGRRRLLGRTSVTTLLQADRIWELGYSGRGIKVRWGVCVYARCVGTGVGVRVRAGAGVFCLVHGGRGVCLNVCRGKGVLLGAWGRGCAFGYAQGKVRCLVHEGRVVRLSAGRGRGGLVGAWGQGWGCRCRSVNGIRGHKLTNWMGMVAPP